MLSTGNPRKGPDCACIDPFTWRYAEAIVVHRIMATGTVGAPANTHSLRRVLLVANLDKKVAGPLCDEIRSFLEESGVSVTVFAFQGQASKLPVEEFDLAICLGGDGTVLFCARLLAPAGVPILPINLGRFGFITEVSPDQWKTALRSWCDGALSTSNRMLLSVTVERSEQRIGEFTALNDMVISSGGTSKSVRIIHLTVRNSTDIVARYRADGLIISTPTGSTGYSVAAGGPILHPELDAMLMNPICPFTLNNRPLIFPGSEELRILVNEYEREDLILTVDGQTLFHIRPDDLITVRRCDWSAAIVRSGERSFYEVLRRKLGWAGGEENGESEDVTPVASAETENRGASPGRSGGA